ncbi:fad linked oxidase domain protein [Lasius niger]|uniref:Fad linked oxidase domain protein n=1 Tax=Lasius niger TaxID=67767 RepID=A0A0J7KCP6_LASNI|nr:fad linked oxidase domain protein [Lasius niger]
MTGNIGTTIQLKDFDLRILSIFGGESSVGLPLMEVGLGEQPEDIIDSASVLGLTSNNVLKENFITEKENNTSTTGKSVNEEDIISFPLSREDPFLQNFNNEQTYQSDNSCMDLIPFQPIDKPCTSNQHDVPRDMLIPLITASKNHQQQIYQVQPNATPIDKPCTSTQHDVPRDMLIPLITASKKSSTTNISSGSKWSKHLTEFFKTFITLHEETLSVLSKIAEVFSKKM